MKIFGIDISSKCTGWSLLENGQLKEYGKIEPNSKMTMAQKLYLFQVELTKILDKYKPDYIAIEDVIYVHSQTTLKVLARFNGIACVCAYGITQQDPTLYEPTRWKKQLINCTGSSKKAEVQLSVCEYFGLLNSEIISKYRDKIIILNSMVNVEGKSELTSLKSKLTREKKKKTKDTVMIKQLQTQVKDLEKTVKKILNQKKKEQKKAFDELSLDIFTRTGINEDIADSIGCALMLEKELTNENT